MSEGEGVWMYICVQCGCEIVYNCDMSARQAAITMEKHHTFCYWQNNSAASRLHISNVYIFA